MKKSSSPEEKRVSAIKTLLKREGLKQIDLANMITVRSKNGEPLSMEPQNLSRSLRSGKVSDKLCRKIGDLFPKYNVMWLLGDSDIMLIKDLRQDFISRSDATNDACLQLLDSALREVCSREGIEIPEINNIPDLLLLQGQLRDFADSLMWNYVRHRKRSHFWGTLDQELSTVEKKLEK